ncbi:MAG: NAD-dependent protein deacylase [Candidatus Omnitrophota bacterium]|nr:MAG: NAD-dependent protein deacylase [Candidatus Omnitrophota bacterium]RKY44997.1 MAG: NAD-dependent protein deacylase [Candidatus Omnitrophota bacterium]
MVEKVAKLLREKKAVAFTGAGASLESGIPTFRGKGGLWEKYDPQIYATVPGILFTFLKSPDKISQFFVDFYEVLLKAKPNSTHYALAELERRGRLLGVITQNIDNLHQLAGSKIVSELHGNAYKFRCRVCNREKIKDKREVAEFLEEIKKSHTRKDLIRRVLSFMGRCECGRRLIPSVVFFGQPLPEEELVKAYQLIDEAELLLIIGTSGVVYPAVNLPFQAKERGCQILEINPELTPLSSIADIRISQSASIFFSQLLGYLG